MTDKEIWAKLTYQLQRFTSRSLSMEKRLEKLTSNLVMKRMINRFYNESKIGAVKKYNGEEDPPHYNPKIALSLQQAFPKLARAVKMSTAFGYETPYLRGASEYRKNLLNSLNRSKQKWGGKRNYIYDMFSDRDKEFHDLRERYGGGVEGSKRAEEYMEHRDNLESSKQKWSGKRAFIYDTLSDYDKEFHNLSEKYGGGRKGRERANEYINNNVFKGFPKFVKNSEFMKKSLFSIAKSLGPSAFSVFKLAGLSIGAFVSGFKSFKSAVVDKVNKSDLNNIKLASNATASGMKIGDFLAQGKALLAYGGNEKDIGTAYKSWQEYIGALSRGGSASGLSTLAKWGVNMFGTGENGFATPEELIKNIAMRMRTLSIPERLALRKELPMNISDALFEAMIYNPEGLISDLHHNDVRAGYINSMAETALNAKRHNARAQGESELAGIQIDYSKLGQDASDYTQSWNNAAAITKDSIRKLYNWIGETWDYLLDALSPQFASPQGVLDYISNNPSYVNNNSNSTRNSINIQNMTINSPDAKMTAQSLAEEANKRVSTTISLDPGYR